jgi:hypothetical protein
MSPPLALRVLASSAVGMALLGGSGCRPTDACAEVGTACGGDPVGAWVEDSACQDPALPDMAISKRTYRGQPLVPAGQSAPEPTSTDWCSDLVWGANGISFLMLPRDTPSIQGAYLNYTVPQDATDHTMGNYGALVTSSDVATIEYSAACLERFGYSANCVQFGEAFATYGVGLGGVKETSCQDAAAGGCVCKYLIESDAAGTNLSGAWVKDPNASVLTHYAANMLLPSRVDYCVQGSQLTLWGHNRTNILDFLGLRTMVFHKVVCGDGKTDRGEQCDPPDQMTCSANCQTLTPP